MSTSSVSSDGQQVTNGRAASQSKKTSKNGRTKAQSAKDVLPPPTGVNEVAATSSVSAEAEQGDGPAAASASSAAVGPGGADTCGVSVVVGPYGAAAASEVGVVVAGPFGTAAASEVGVSSVGPNGAAASSNAANSATAAVVEGEGDLGELARRVAQLERELTKRAPKRPAKR